MNDVIDIKNLTVKYSNKVILDNLTLQFEVGKVYGLLGPNGHGKTTLMKVIEGLIKLNSGDVTIEGLKVSYKTKAIVAYMPTENYLIANFKVSKCIDYYNDMFADFDKQFCYDLMKKLEIDTNMKISKLSSGLVAKVKIALTLGRDAKIYLFDEPLNGIDYLAKSIVIDTIINCHNENKTFIIASHMIDEIENILDNVIFIKNGEIVVDGVADDIRINKNMSIANVYTEVFKL